MEIITNTTTRYVCGECGRKHKTQKECLSCEKRDIKRAEVASYALDNRELINGTSKYMFYADSPQRIDDYMSYMECGCITDDNEYDDFDYPCYVIIGKYYESMPYEEPSICLVHIKSLGGYRSDLESAKLNIQDRINE